MDSDLEFGAEVLGEILRALPEIVLVVGADNRIRYLNRAGADRDPQRFIGTRAQEFLFADSKGVFEGAMQALAASGEMQEHEFRIALPDGFDGWYRMRMIPLDEGGTTMSVLVVGTDITELREAEAEVAQLRQLLPVCAWCGSIQNDAGDWEGMESYLEREAGTKVSHGMCPGCFELREDELPAGSSRG